MSLAEILRANSAFVQATAKPGPTRDELPVDPRKTLVVTCCCPELTERVEAAMGLRSGRACIIRIAGAWGGREAGDLLRSVPLALHLHGCSEIVVVGHDGCVCCPADRQKILDHMSAAGLVESAPGRGKQILEQLRSLAGPSSPETGVLETVRKLKDLNGVPPSCQIHGCMLDPASYTLRVISQDRAVRREAGPATVQKEQVPDPSLPPMPELPLLEIPEIVLPEIPALDLDALTPGRRPPPLRRKSAPYGSTTPGVGPVPFGDVLTMQKLSAPANESTQEPDEKHRHKVQRLEAQPDVIALESVSPKPNKGKDQKVSGQNKPHAGKMVEIVASEMSAYQAQTPQAPLGEQLIAFDEPAGEKKTSRSNDTLVDLEAGELFFQGAEVRLDPELWRALRAVSHFVSQVFPTRQRAEMVVKIRQDAKTLQPTGEILKILIAPILKLGKKRYTVVNDLLKIKEELPRLDPLLVVTILEAVLGAT